MNVNLRLLRPLGELGLIQPAILNCFGNVLVADGVDTCQIRNGSRQFQNAMIGAC